VVKLADFLKDCPCAQRELVCVCCPLEPLVFFVSKKYALPGLRKKMVKSERGPIVLEATLEPDVGEVRKTYAWLMFIFSKLLQLRYGRGFNLCV
jgi:hypothetical protein